MIEIFETKKLRENIKLELEIMADFFDVQELQMMVIDSNNMTKVFNSGSKSFEVASAKIIPGINIYDELFEADEKQQRNILKKYFDDFKKKLLSFKLTINNYIYIVYFPYDNLNSRHDSSYLVKFRRQMELILKDIYSDKKRETDLEKKERENKNLKKEKYIAASALDSVPGNISILDEKGNILYTNISWDKFAFENDGLLNNTGVGNNYLKVTKEAAADGDKKAQAAYDGILKVLNKKSEYFTLDYPCDSPSEKRWFRMYVSSFKGAGEYEVLILHQDVTKEIMAKKNSEMMMDQLPGVFLKLNNKKELITFNQKAKKIFNLNKVDIGQKFNKLKLKNKKGITYEDKLKEVLTENKKITFRVMIEDDLDHSYKNILIPITEESNSKNIISIIPYGKNRTRKEKQKVTNHYLQLFNNFPEALVLLDIDKKVINANNKFKGLFGYQLKELKNKKLDELITKSGSKTDTDDLIHRVLTGEKIEKEVRRITYNGNKLKLKLTAFPVLLHDNKIGVYAIYRKL